MNDKITIEHIESAIVSEAFYIFPQTTVTVCCLQLKNGYCVIGESATVSPATFDAAIGRGVARSNAVGKIWALEGYLLKQRRHENGQADDVSVMG